MTDIRKYINRYLYVYYSTLLSIWLISIIEGSCGMFIMNAKYIPSDNDYEQFMIYFYGNMMIIRSMLRIISWTIKGISVGIVLAGDMKKFKLLKYDKYVVVVMRFSTCLLLVFGIYFIKTYINATLDSCGNFQDKPKGCISVKILAIHSCFNLTYLIFGFIKMIEKRSSINFIVKSLTFTSKMNNNINETIKMMMFERSNMIKISESDLILSTICSICFENSSHNLESNDIFWIKLGCEHFYHQQCLDKWMMIKNTCPMCRNIIIDESKWENIQSFLVS